MDNSNSFIAAVLRSSGRYDIQRTIGRGSYGTVLLALDCTSLAKVAIKHIPVVRESGDGVIKKTLREIRIMRLLNSEFVLPLISVDIISNHIFIVTPYQEYDLSTWRKSPMYFNLSESHHLNIFYQLFRAIRYIHAAGVLHRDIKPSNVLIDSHFMLRLCDFGLSRIAHSLHNTSEDLNDEYTEYMVTRWYRAPEVFLNPGKYGKEQDIWSAGCTLGEFITGVPFFPGNTCAHQIRVIVERLGGVSSDDLNFEMSPRCRAFMENFQSRHLGWTALGIEKAIGDGVVNSILKRCLQFNPNSRISAEEVLLVPDLREIHNHRSLEENVESTARELHFYVNESCTSLKDLSERVKRLFTETLSSSSRATPLASLEANRKKLLSLQRTLSHRPPVWSLGGWMTGYFRPRIFVFDTDEDLKARDTSNTIVAEPTTPSHFIHYLLRQLFPFEIKPAGAVLSHSHLSSSYSGQSCSVTKSSSGLEKRCHAS